MFYFGYKTNKNKNILLYKPLDTWIRIRFIDYDFIYKNKNVSRILVNKTKKGEHYVSLKFKVERLIV